MDTLRGFSGVSLVLVIIGALNWGLVGLFDFNLVTELFGADSVLTNIVYVLVGIAGIVLAVTVPQYFFRTRATDNDTVSDNRIDHRV